MFIKLKNILKIKFDLIKKRSMKNKAQNIKHLQSSSENLFTTI